MSAVKRATPDKVIKIEQERRDGKMKQGGSLLLGCLLLDPSFSLLCCDLCGQGAVGGVSETPMTAGFLPYGFSSWKH